MGKVMTDKVEFRTSEECLLKLVAHTMMVDYDEKKAKAVVAFARAFGYIPNDYMRNA